METKKTDAVNPALNNLHVEEQHRRESQERGTYREAGSSTPSQETYVGADRTKEDDERLFSKALTNESTLDLNTDRGLAILLAVLCEKQGLTKLDDIMRRPNRLASGVTGLKPVASKKWHLIHNAIAHPLMVVLPESLGNLVHDWTGKKAFGE